MTTATPIPPGAPSSSSSLTERLRGARVAARPDLQGSRHVFGNDVSYVLQDPVTFESHRLSENDYHILTSLRSDKTLGTVFSELVQRRQLDAASEERFYRFVANLQQRGMLSLPFTNGSALYERQKQQRSRLGLLSWLSIPLPMLNPNALLERTAVVGQVLYSRVAFALWLTMMLMGGGILWNRWPDFVNPLTEVAANQHGVVLWMAFIGLKVLHEFGHAYACKRFGGYVPDMGFILVALNPCAYVDCSAAWGFPNRWHRIVVSLGGMYVESIVAFLALLVWNATGPSTLNSCAHHVVLMAAFVTLFFNLNPLIKYDGYFVLCDLIGVPNLKQRATAHVQMVGKRFVLGLPGVQVVWNRQGWLMLSYGVLSSIYRVGMITGMTVFLATKVMVVGIALGLYFFYTTIAGLVTQTCHYLWWSEETAPMRGRAVVWSAVLLVGIPVGIGAIPMPSRMRIDGTVAKLNEYQVRLVQEGIVREVFAPAGTEVDSQTALATVENVDVASLRDQQAATLRRATTEYLAAQAVDHAKAKQLLQKVSFQRQQLEKSREDVRELNVTATRSGVLLQTLTPREQGQFLPAGSLVAVVGDGPWIVRAIANADLLTGATPNVGQTVTCRLANAPSRVVSGRITNVAPTGSRLVSMTALTQLGGGDVVVNSATKEAAESFFEITVELEATPAVEFHHGTTAVVALNQNYDPLALSLYRRALRFWNNLMAKS